MSTVADYWFTINQYIRAQDTATKNLIIKYYREYKYIKNWNWIDISINGKLTEEFMDMFQDKIYWTHISMLQNLSETTIRKFKDSVNWEMISKNQTLSEDFIREFQDKVEWDLISTYQSLSESFIRAFQHDINWLRLSSCQILSDEFINEFEDNLQGRVMLNKIPISYELIMSHNPCETGIKRYLEHTGKDETITWNELLRRHKNKLDVLWLYNNITKSK